MAEDKLNPLTQEVNIDIKETGADSATKKIDGLNVAIEQTETATRVVGKSMGDLDKTFDEVYKDLKPLTARMGEAEDRLYELALAGKTAGDEYQGLLAKVANYRKTQIETDRVVDAAATTLGQKLGGASQIAATSVQSVTAGMALFGDQSEDTEKALLKVQAAMAFADSISSFSQLGGQFRVFKDLVVSGYQKIFAAKTAEIAATNQATAAQNRLNLSVLKNPYVAAAAAIAAIVIVTYQLVKANSEAAKTEEEVANSIDKTSKKTKELQESTDRLNKTQTDANGIEVLRAKAYGATDEQINKLIKSQKELAIQRASELKKEAFSNYAKAESDYYRALRGDNEENTEKAKENLNEAFEFYKKSQEQKREADLEATKFDLETQISTNEKQKQIREKAEEDARNKRKASREKALEDAKKEAEEDAAALLEFQRTVANAAADNQTQEIENEFVRKKEQSERILKLAEEQANREIEIEEARLELKRSLQESETQITDKALGLATVLAGKNKALQKTAVIAEGAVGVARTVRSTSQGNAAALALGIAQLGPIAGPPAAAPAITANTISGGVSIAAQVAATAKALQALGGGSASSSGASIPVGQSGGGGSPTRNVAQVGFQGSSESQISDAINRRDREQPPIQAFVVSQEVTDQQELDRKKLLNNGF